jgi:hypothetical protein
MRTVDGLSLVLLAALALGGCGKADDTAGVATAHGTASASAAASGGAPVDEKERALQFATCVRANGIPDFPDPKFNAGGGTSLNLPPGLDQAKVDKALAACKKYQVNGGEPSKLDPERLDKLRAYAKCMRDNGITNFPDPTDQGIQGDGLDMDSPSVKAADAKCSKYGPAAGSDGGRGTSAGQD